MFELKSKPLLINPLLEKRKNSQFSRMSSFAKHSSKPSMLGGKSFTEESVYAGGSVP
jgi:hypothetical protein